MVTQLIWLLSEFEALYVRPNSRLRIRRLYLKLMGVKCPNVFWVGKSFHLLRRGNLSLGERCALGEFARLDNHAPIEIGDDFLAAPGLCISAGTHDPISLIPKCTPIRIGNHVWCGVNVTILNGVTIGDNVVIGAGSLVNKDIPSNSMAVGVPAKVVKTLNRDGAANLWTWVSKVRDEVVI
jgi:maltose O-acetyltransferase